MTCENNLHVSDELLSQLQAIASASGKTTEELAEEAVRRLLEHQALDNLAARGGSHAERAGRKPSDAVAAVREVRRGR
jgi:predicted transcriptional regulator